MIHKFMDKHDCGCNCCGNSRNRPSSSGGPGCMGFIISIVIVFFIMAFILTGLGVDPDSVPGIVLFLIPVGGGIAIRVLIYVFFE